MNVAIDGSRFIKINKEMLKWQASEYDESNFSQKSAKLH